MLNLEKIEEYFPSQGALCAAGDRITVSSQWLHDFARNVAAAEREACGEIANKKAAEVLAKNTYRGRTNSAALFAAGILEDVGADIRNRTTTQTPCQPAPPLLVGLERD